MHCASPCPPDPPLPKAAPGDRPRIKLWMAALAVTLLALGLRLHGLGHESLSMDEIRQVETYGLPFAGIMREALTHAQPPLDYWIGSLVGHPESDSLVRLPSALFGTASVLLLIALCARFIPGPWAALPGLLLALSPYSIFYSQHARPYHISIFFALATLWALDLALRREKISLFPYILLFLCATAFLWSRVFTPMVTIAALMAALVARGVIAGVAEERWLDEGQKKRMLSLAVLLAALAAFFPFFRLLLKGGEKWASSGGLTPMALLAKGISALTPIPLAKSYLTQMDPLGLVLLPFVLAAPVLALVSPEWRKDPLLFLAPIALPLAGVMELAGFGATSDFANWRTPYPIWVLPLGMISAAATLAFLARSPLPRRILPRIALAGFLVMLAGMSARSAVSFKTAGVKNDDWRGVCQWLEKNGGPRQFIFFGSVVPFDNWEPTFWGFPRYYRGRSPLLGLAYVSQYVSNMAGMAGEPVFVIYRYREELVTPSSPFPVFTPLGYDPEIGTGNLAADPALNVRLFNAFAVVRLRTPTGDLARDTYEGLEAIIRDYPQRVNHLGRLHLAAAFLGRSVGASSWERHLAAAGMTRGANPRYTPLLDLLRRN